MQTKNSDMVAGTKTNLCHGEFLFSSSQILIQSVDGLLMLLCGSSHALSFLSKRSYFFPVALNVVLQHLIPDIVDTDSHFSGLCTLQWILVTHVK